MKIATAKTEVLAKYNEKMRKKGMNLLGGIEIQ